MLETSRTFLGLVLLNFGDPRWKFFGLVLLNFGRSDLEIFGFVTFEFWAVGPLGGFGRSELVRRVGGDVRRVRAD